MPDETDIAGIRRGIEAYEAARASTLRQVRWRVPLFVGLVLVVVALIAWLFNKVADPHEQWFSTPHVFLYVGGFFLMGLSGVALANVFREAKAAGVTTVLDVVTPAGQADHLAELAPVLPFTDAFLPNQDEGHAITGKSDTIEQAEVFRRAGAKTVAITAGGAGCFIASERERLRAGVYPTSFVDATGGGDAFDAGFIFGLLHDLPLRDCIRWGSALGASCVRQTAPPRACSTRRKPRIMPA